MEWLLSDLPSPGAVENLFPPVGRCNQVTGISARGASPAGVFCSRASASKAESLSSDVAS